MRTLFCLSTLVYYFYLPFLYITTMKNNYFLTLIFYFLLVSTSVFSQKEPIYGSASGTKHDEMLANDASYRAAFEAYKESYNQYLKQVKGGRPGATKAVVTLPIVFHVVYPTGGATPGTSFNPSDAQIDAALAFMNQSFRKTRAGTCGVDTEIQFAKAVRGPNCAATTGINRVDGSGVANYDANGINSSSGTAAVEASVKSLIKWDQSSYINVWIVNEIDGFDGYSGSGVAGYAYLPITVKASNSNLDGVVVLASQIIGATGRTLTHEVGHYLGLLHTFQGDGTGSTCPPNGSCTTDGDLVCDTEAYKRADGAGVTCPTPAATLNTCTMANFVVAADGCSVLNNYMSYTPNSCRNMFTAGQSTLMQSTVAPTGLRSSLVSSLALTAAAAGPASACTFTDALGLGNAFGLENFSLNTLNIQSGGSSVDQANYIDHSCTQKTTLRKGYAYPISMKGWATNAHRFRVLIDLNNDGDFDDTGEQLFSASGSNTASGTLTIPTSVSGTGARRIRVIADNSIIDNCSGSGAAGFGGGQAEDFCVDLQAALPVELVTFRGEVEDNQRTNLQWATATETNSSHFIVERSKDLKNYETIGQVDAKGNSDTYATYRLTDYKPTFGVNYYRLTQVDLDQTTHTYKPVAIAVGSNDGPSVYPNPNSTQRFVVRVPFVEKIDITDSQGHIVTTQLKLLQAGEYEAIPTQKLKTGTHFLILHEAQTIRSVKVLVTE
jgi:Pregnancy-associated plasma protein-A/GEVED domain